MSDHQGAFVWSQLGTSDVDGARQFYGDVVGWSSEGFGGPEPSYWIWKAGDVVVGGLTASDAPPSWLPYVYATDVDALVRKAEALGGSSRMAPHDVPGVGRIAVVADPQGAVLAAIRPDGPDREPEPPRPGEVVWRELMCDDPAAALRYYGELLGWREHRALDMGASGTYRIYGTADRELGGMMQRLPGYPLAPHFLLYVHVVDLDAALERVRAGGGSVWMGPMPIPTGMRIAQCADPQGAVFALHGE